MALFHGRVLFGHFAGFMHCGVNKSLVFFYLSVSPYALILSFLHQAVEFNEGDEKVDSIQKRRLDRPHPFSKITIVCLSLLIN